MKRFYDKKKDIIGGKAASLIRIKREGFNVPCFFVIKPHHLEKFLAENDIEDKINSILEKVNINKIKDVNHASSTIKNIINGGKINRELQALIDRKILSLKGPEFAVRSSASVEDSKTMSWAGQFDSFMNVGRNEIYRNIKKCWGSLFNTNVLIIKSKFNVNNIGISVIIQEMVKADFSGVGLSMDMDNLSNDRMTIEAIKGLGHLIVSGQVDPTTYIIDEREEIILRRINRKQYKFLSYDGKVRKLKFESKDVSMKASQIIKICKTIKKLKAIFKLAVDVEWSISKKRLYILQCRPIVFSDNKLSKFNMVEKLVTLDVPLSFIELHSYLEYATNRLWAKKRPPVKPYNLYVSKFRRVSIYYNVEDIYWSMIQAYKLRRDKNFLLKQLVDKYKEISILVERPKPLSFPELRIFLKKVQLCWGLANYLWWLIEVSDLNNLKNKKLISVRKKTEKFISGIISILRNTTEHNLPYLYKYKDQLLLSEILSRRIPPDTILRRRAEGYGFASKKFYINCNKMFSCYNTRILNDKITDRNNLLGRPVYPGIIRGKARVVLNKEDMLNFNKGEIFISGTTFPDFLSVMRKASAIISEHGGVVSHAAIISRELRIPCVVGVKGLLDSINTSDIIEVNAVTGLIKIINKS